MCGICGFINLDSRPAERSIVERMNRALAHRGPDGDGVFVDGEMAMAMRRLAIIDVEGGDQPMPNEDASIWIIFNGEIYNSPQLYQHLNERGHRFKTYSDTETIVHQYEELGASCIDTLHGMFAFALYDRRNPNAPMLILARDRIGIKPLFYYADSRALVFASELTSLVQHPAVPREIDLNALHRYLATGAVAAPLTMFKHVRQLMPGQRLLAQNGQWRIETYWELPDLSLNPLPSQQELVSQLRHLLEQSVREHLLADVPVGAFLSGGIDSSTVVALMARAAGNRVSTFSIRFEESGYDESSFARMVAQRYETNHHEFTVPNASFDFDLLQALVTHHGQPTADSSAIPMFIVSRLAREFVKVALSGDGGDECFAGYAHYGWAQQIDSWYAMPRWARQTAASTARTCASIPGLDQNERLRQIWNAFDISLVERPQVALEIMRLNSESEIADIMVSNGNKDDALATFLRNGQGDAIHRVQCFSFRHYLPDTYLSKVDRMSMATALEVRVPLLDHRLVEFSLSLPGDLHWHHGLGKQLLRQAVADLLPPEIFAHRKQGFSIPLHTWTTQAYFDLAEELLSEDAVRRRGLFDPVHVRALLDRCRGRLPQRRSLESDYRLSHRLYQLVVFELWCRSYMDSLIEYPSETSRWLGNVCEVKRV